MNEETEIDIALFFLFCDGRLDFLRFNFSHHTEIA
jgi:hypothetical protein